MTVTSMDASIADARSQIMAFLATDKGDAKRRVLISLGMNLLLDGSTADPPLKVPPVWSWVDQRERKILNTSMHTHTPGGSGLHTQGHQPGGCTVPAPGNHIQPGNGRR